MFLLNIILTVFTQDYLIRLVNCIILTIWTITSYSIVHFVLTPTSRPGLLEAALSKDLLTDQGGVPGVQVPHHLVNALPGGWWPPLCTCS